MSLIFSKVISLFRTTLGAPMTSTQTTMTLNVVPSGNTQYPNWLVVEPNTLNAELIYCPTAPSGDLFSGVVRGVDPTLDTDAAGTGIGHSANVTVILAPIHRQWNNLVDVMQGEQGTGYNAVRVGDGNDSDIYIYAENADSDKPFMRYDHTTSKWLFSNDGVNTYDPEAGGSGLTAGLGIAIFASEIDLNPRSGGGLRNNQGVGSAQADVDPAIVATLGAVTNTFTGAVYVNTPPGGSAVGLAADDLYVNATVTGGGTGADGALAITSGTTTIDLGGAAIFIKNYLSISITGTGAVAFINPHAGGSTIVFKCQGNCTITSSASPAIQLAGLGGVAGTGGAHGTNAGTSGTAFAGIIDSLTHTGLPGSGGVNSLTSAAAAGGAAGGATNASITAWKGTMVVPGAGGAGGGGGGDGTSGIGGVGGNGGQGAGSLVLFVAGNFTCSSTINAAGTAGSIGGSNVTNTVNYDLGSAGGGGGGGGGGSIAISVTGTITWSGTATVTGGAAGAAGVGLVGANGGGGGGHHGAGGGGASGGASAFGASTAATAGVSLVGTNEGGVNGGAGSAGANGFFEIMKNVY